MKCCTLKEKTFFSDFPVYFCVKNTKEKTFLLYPLCEKTVKANI